MELLTDCLMCVSDVLVDRRCTGGGSLSRCRFDLICFTRFGRSDAVFSVIC